MKKFLTFSLIFFTFFSCTKTDNHDGYKYPDSKVWKHRVNTKEELKDARKNFDGVEIDIFYVSEKNDIFVGHSYADTVNHLLFSDLLSSLRKAKKLCYWLDFKYLNVENAEQAISALNVIAERYKIKERIFIESWSQKALSVAKSNGFHTMLWVTSLSYKKYETLDDTISLLNNIRSSINNLNPDAISCVSAMFPILCDSFPEQNIHFWDTPKKYTPENVESTKKICQNENVKIVLVDYPNPIDY